MFSLLFCQETTSRVLNLEVCGIKSNNGTVVWDTPIEYALAKRFLDDLNERAVAENDLFDAAWEFLLCCQEQRGSSSD